MTPYFAYIEYNAIKNHFNKLSYDYIKYEGKIRASEISFNKRPDKIFFQKLAKHEDLKNFLIANFVVNKKSFSKTLAYSETAQEIYKEWLLRQQSLTYIFKQDLNMLSETNFDDNFLYNANGHPLLLKQFLGKKVCIETISILLDLKHAIPYWNKKMPNDPIWHETEFRITKYLPFINYEKEKFKKIIVDKYT